MAWRTPSPNPNQRKNVHGQNVFTARRKFFFFYSNLTIFDPKGKQIGPSREILYFALNIYCVMGKIFPIRANQERMVKSLGSMKW